MRAADARATAAGKPWEAVQLVDLTDNTISLRLIIRREHFVHGMLAELTGSLYFLEGLEPKPLLSFSSIVENILIQHELY